MNNKRFVSKLLLVLISMGACAPHQEDAIVNCLEYLKRVSLQTSEMPISMSGLVQRSLQAIQAADLEDLESVHSTTAIVIETIKVVDMSSESLACKIADMKVSLSKAKAALGEGGLPPEEVTTLEREIKILSESVESARKTIELHEKLLIPIRSELRKHYILRRTGRFLADAERGAVVGLFLSRGKQ